MYRVHIVAMLLVTISFPTAAQRLDGCVDYSTPGVKGAGLVVTREARDHGLQDAGYSLTQNSLFSALDDRRPDVRSAAAQRLAEVGGKVELDAILHAWLTEKDGCSRNTMVSALSELLYRIAWDPAKHPGGQWRITPFQSCSPSRNPLVSLMIERAASGNLALGPEVRISMRNETPKTLAFARTESPEALFSVTVIGPGGEPAKITKGQEWMYAPVRRDNLGAFMGGFRVTLQPLAPGEDVPWIWRIANDFDMSVPGTYRVSFGGRIDYLDTTICSNTLFLTVQK